MTTRRLLTYGLSAYLLKTYLAPFRFRFRANQHLVLRAWGLQRLYKSRVELVALRLRWRPLLPDPAKLFVLRALGSWIEAVGFPGPPNYPFIEPFWSLIVGIWGILEGSWGV